MPAFDPLTIEAAVERLMMEESEGSEVPLGFSGPPSPVGRRTGSGSPSRKHGLNPLLLAAPPLAALADAYTTRSILHGGGTELNPLAAPWANASDPVLFGSKVGLGLLTSGAAELAAKSGHRKTAILATVLGALGPAAGAAWNTAQQHRARKP